MTEKMYYNLRKKYNNSVFLILKIYKAFSNFDFNSTTWKKIHWVVQLFGDKVIERILLIVIMNIQINSPTYLFSTLLLDNKGN